MGMMKAFPKSVATVMRGKDSRFIQKEELRLLGDGLYLYVESKE